MIPFIYLIFPIPGKEVTKLLALSLITVYQLVLVPILASKPICRPAERNGDMTRFLIDNV